MSYDAETSSPRRRWGVSREAALLWRSWGDGEYVVYSTASGDTHLINEVTAVVLRQLERSDLAFSELVRQVAETLGTGNSPQIEASVARLLARLDQIGLVEPDS